MRTRTRSVAAAALLTLAAAFVTACGSSAGSNPAEGSGNLSVVPTESGTPGTPPPPPPPPPPAALEFPDSAPEYALAVVEAWGGDDSDWLDALTTESVAHEIFDLNASPYDDWLLDGCDGAATEPRTGAARNDRKVVSTRDAHRRRDFFDRVGQHDDLRRPALDRPVVLEDDEVFGGAEDALRCERLLQRLDGSLGYRVRHRDYCSRPGSDAEWAELDVTPRRASARGGERGRSRRRCLPAGRCG